MTLPLSLRWRLERLEAEAQKRKQDRGDVLTEAEWDALWSGMLDEIAEAEKLGPIDPLANPRVHSLRCLRDGIAWLVDLQERGKL